jgi:6-phosphogluconate dehydrogenase (decarboxylating)
MAETHISKTTFDARKRSKKRLHYVDVGTSGGVGDSSADTA